MFQSSSAPKSQHPSMKTIASTSKNVKLPQAAIECGTLDVFLELLPPNTTILLTQLMLVTPHTGLYKRHHLVHVTALAPSNHILYAAFHAAQTLGLADTPALIEPFTDRDGEGHAQRLLNEMQQCLQEVIQAHPNVKHIKAPARYRLPDDWVWNLRSRTDHIILREKHWSLEQKRRQQGEASGHSTDDE